MYIICILCFNSFRILDNQVSYYEKKKLNKMSKYPLSFLYLFFFLLLIFPTLGILKITVYF